jgi:hypothetical protein
VEFLSHTSIDMRMMYASWSGVRSHCAFWDPHNWPPSTDDGAHAETPNLLVTCKIPHKGITADSLADLAPVALEDEMRWPLLALHLHPPLTSFLCSLVYVGLTFAPTAFAPSR